MRHVNLAMCLLLTTLKLYPCSDRDAEIKGSISPRRVPKRGYTVHRALDMA